MMKKEYITPEMIIRQVILEGIMQPQSSLDLVDDPLPQNPGWGVQESKEGNGLWSDDNNDVWED